MDNERICVNMPTETKKSEKNINTDPEDDQKGVAKSENQVRQRESPNISANKCNENRPNILIKR